MRLLQITKMARSGRPRLKGSPLAAPYIGKCALGLALVLVAWAASVWLLVPFIVFALTSAKTDFVGLSDLVDAYLGESFFTGWAVVKALPLYEVPSRLLVLLLSVAAVVLALWVISESAGDFEGKSVFGPAASRGNEKGSARLFTNELELALLTKTWDGSWQKPPDVAVPIIGYSHAFGYYLAPEEIHTIAFGSTGSGKTTTLNYCSIDALAAAGASVVVTDPKGELYDQTSAGLRAKGVDVRIVDFSNVARSEGINPVLPITRTYEQRMEEHAAYLERASKIALDAGVDPSLAASKGLWEDERAYRAYELELKNADAVKREAWSASENYARDLAGALVPPRADAGDAAHWEECARQLLTSLILLVGIYEEKDYVGADDAYTAPLPAQRTLQSVHTLLSRYGEATDRMKALSKIMSNLDENHPACTNFAQAKNADTREYKTTVAEAIKFLTSVLGDATNALLNGSDIDLSKLGKKQSVIFVVLPDERPMVGKIFTTIVSQSYQLLVDTARQNGGRLPVPVHFLLEELGNLASPIPDLASKMSMGRGYGMFFHITLQSIDQLRKRYGKEDASTIMEACGAKLLLKANDALVTGRYFSESMGKYTYTSKRTTKSRKPLALSSDSSSDSASEGERWLMSADELTRWDPAWGTIALLSKPGKAPGPLVRSLFGYQTMMPSVFPREFAWNTPTADNLDIRCGYEHKSEKSRIAQAESRVSMRIPSVPWEPKCLKSSERIELSRLLVPGGISPHAIEDYRRHVAGQGAREFAAAYLAEHVGGERLLAKGAPEIDLIATEVSKAYGALLDRASSSGKGLDARSRNVSLAAITGVVFEILSAALESGDVSMLAKGQGSRPDPPERAEALPPEPDRAPLPERVPASQGQRAASRKKGSRPRSKSWIDDIRSRLREPYAKAADMDEFLRLAFEAGVLAEEAHGTFAFRLKGSNCTIGAAKLNAKYEKKALAEHFCGEQTKG